MRQMKEAISNSYYRSEDSRGSNGSRKLSKSSNSSMLSRSQNNKTLSQNYEELMSIEQPVKTFK